MLETIIFPYFIESSEFSHILFVGCRWYTMRYRKAFEGKDYWTLDIDPRQRRYGARKHIIDSMENLARHFKDNALDLVVCNGVFGWGLNNKADAENALQGCHQCLREGGVLLLGWNDVPQRRPFHPRECRTLALFDPWVFPPLSASEYLTDTRNRHTYDFYVKPGSADRRSA
ncbi:MAG: class I SAM-dependent methyltransferase [Candidatus Sumerlaeota bacterium]|nr:class I SAM-dependent methyltransferase [Candidatus Sumerlaeota bacterium]